MKPDNTNEDFGQLEQQLKSLHDVDMSRDPITIKNGRSAFIKEVEGLTVSKSEYSRLTFQERIHYLFNSGKEKYKMTPALISIVAAVILFFGGGSVGLVAAQNSLPDDLLYPIKLTTESVQLALADGTDEKINLEMDLSANRLEEIIQLLKTNKTPDESQFNRLDNHLMTAFKLAMDTSTQNAGEMTMLQNRLQEQVRLMEQVQVSENTPDNASLTRTRSMLQDQTRMVDEWITQTTSQGSGNAIESSPLGQDPTQSLDQQKDQTQTQDQTRDQSQDQTQVQSQEQIQTQNQVQSQEQIQTQNQVQSQEQIQTQNQVQEQNGNGPQYSSTQFPTPLPTITPYSMNNGAGSGNSGNPGSGGSGGKAK